MISGGEMVWVWGHNYRVIVPYKLSKQRKFKMTKNSGTGTQGCPQGESKREHATAAIDPWIDPCG